MRFSLFILTLALAFSACKQNAQPEQTAEAANAEFKDFYDKFHRDSAFQVEHIQFPLEGIPSMADSAFLASGAKYYWPKKGWEFMQEVDFSTGIYTQDLMVTDFLVEERIFDKHGFFTLRRFYKMGDDWKLIYYSGLNQVGENRDVDFSR